MSVLKVYLNWANSILSEVDEHVDGVADIQNGKCLCELIDVLAPDAQLVDKLQTSGGRNSRTYLHTALDHMQSHGIKFSFTVQDLLDGDIKSLLDVLWLVILNYSIHHIAQNTYQRSVGIGKKHLLDWCQLEVDAIFDPRNTLSFNLCTGNWFTRLLHKFSGEERSEDEDRVNFLEKLLHKIQDKYAISEDIVSASDVVDGTVDEHTLMIYLSLLRRRVRGTLDENSRNTSYNLTLPPGGLDLTVISQNKRSRSASPLVTRSCVEEDDKYCSDSELFGRLAEASGSQRNHQLLRHKAAQKAAHGNMSSTMSAARSHESMEDGSDWFSSTSGSMISSPVGRLSPGKDGRTTPLDPGREQVVKETISQQVWELMPQSELDEELQMSTSLTNGHHGYVEENLVSGSGTDTSEKAVHVERGSSVDNKTSVMNDSSDIKIRRPKDYFRQWEDTIDRLSHGPVGSDLDSSRSSSRSRSRSHDSNRIQGDNALQRNMYSEQDSLRSVSNSPSRGFHSRSPSNTYSPREQFSQRKSSPSPQRHDSHLSRNTQLLHRERKTESATSRSGLTVEHKAVYQSSSRREVTRESAGKPSEIGISDMGGGELDPGQQLLHIEHLLAGADIHKLASSFKPGQKVDVSVLFEALRKAREAVDNNMPKDDFRSRRLQQRRDLNETDLKHVESAVEGNLRTSISQSGILDDTELNIVNEQSSPVTNELSAVHSPGRDIRHLERERSPSTVIGLSRRHPSMSPRRVPERLNHEPVGDKLSADKEQHEHSIANGGSAEGGYGRVARREAWERQQRHSDIPIDASRMDSLAQAKFVEALCKEIEELKHKVEVMDRPRQMVSNPSKSTATARSRQRSDYGEIDKIENPFGLEMDVHDQNGEMLFETSRSRSASPRYSHTTPSGVRSDSLSRSSDRYQERLGRSLNVDSHEALRSPEQPRSRSLSPHLQRQSPTLDFVDSGGFWNRSKPPAMYESRYTSSVSPRRYDADTSGGGRHLTSLYSSLSTPDLSRQPISLGYSSPVRSVTQEIWGNKLNKEDTLEPRCQDRWKQLIANRNLTDEDVIELKQALASSIVENNILQAKLNNAKSEVSQKLYHTNGVLDDCRKHLAKSQAENMELRSNLESERQQTQDLEVQVKELDEALYDSKTQLTQLEAELEQTRGELNQTTRDQPTLDEVRKQNQLIQADLNRAESINHSLKQEVEDVSVTREKAQATIRDLRTCLEEVRQERSHLFEEVMCLQLASDGQKAKVQSIIHRYNDKESKEVMNGRLHDQSPTNQRHTRRPEVAVSPIRIHSESTPKGHHRTSTLNDELLADACTKLDGSLNLSGIAPASGSPATAAHVSLNTSSPGVPSSYREIYPHRKSRYYNQRESPVLFIDYPDLQQYPVKLSYMQCDSEDVDRPSRKATTDSVNFRDLSHSNVIRRKLRYSPVLDKDDCEDDTWLNSCEDFANPSIIDTVVESPAPTRHLPVRLSQSLHESSTGSSRAHRNRDAERLNRSHNAVYDITRAGVNASGLTMSRRGILKNGNLLHGSRLRERSCSPILQRHDRPHSPPTRLSPRSRSPGSKPSSRQPWQGRSSSLERSLQRQLDSDSDFFNSNPQLSAIKRKAWYELQINDNKKLNRNRFAAEVAAQLLQEPAVLNDEQRRYADHLIEKYTGLPLPECSVITS